MTTGKGAEARRRQWNAVAGGRAGRPNLAFVAGGVVAGAIAGAIFGQLDLPLPEAFPTSLALAALLAPAGGYGGHMFSSSNAFQQGMMLVHVNERRSVIRPEMVTGQAEAWVPKALLAWRAHEWRYQDGRPYMWLQLAPGDRIEEQLHGTADYLFLANDLHRAKDAAVYAQRSWNRKISDSALDYADVDEGEEGKDNLLQELAPYLIAGVISLLGFLMVIMTLD